MSPLSNYDATFFFRAIVCLTLVANCCLAFTETGRINSVLSIKSLSSRGRKSAVRWMSNVAPSQLPRREMLLMGGVSIFLAGRQVFAFENRVVELSPTLKGRPYGEYTPVPTGVGIGGALKGCPSFEDMSSSAPNCFSSAASKDDREHYFPPLRFSKTSKAAMNDLVDAVRAYPPGQADIDAGGWKIMAQTDDYLYVQFESGKIGYLDDLEFTLDKGGNSVLLRSASRAGTLDLGVNAKRINWFVGFLESRGGWSATRITKALYPVYFDRNGVE